jgi:GNAT superfamily N-acetyltransferase
MVHALEVLPHQRRKGVARWAMRQAAFWAQSQSATTLTVLCTQENFAANQLYGSLGMQLVGQYHYRTKKELS